MSDEWGPEDAEVPEREDSETPASQRSAASQSSTGGQGDAGTEGQADAGSREEAALSGQKGGAESAKAPESAAGESQAAPAVDRQADEKPRDLPPEPAAPVVDRRKTPRGPRPSLSEERQPVFHDEGGYRLRIDPSDLAKLRELPGAKGKTDRELGEQFFNGHSPRLIASIAGDVATPAEVRVVVDPYSRQAFLAVGRTIRGIVSF